MSTMYNATVVDFDAEERVVEATVSREDVVQILRNFTQLSSTGRAEFMARLAKDGIAQNMGKWILGQTYDVMVMKEI